MASPGVSRRSNGGVPLSPEYRHVAPPPVESEYTTAPHMLASICIHWPVAAIQTHNPRRRLPISAAIRRTWRISHRHPTIPPPPSLHCSNTLPFYLPTLPPRLHRGPTVPPPPPLPRSRAGAALQWSHCSLRALRHSITLPRETVTRRERYHHSGRLTRWRGVPC